MRLATDEDFNRDIIRGVRTRRPGTDILETRDAGLRGAPDPKVLDWSAREGRILFTHDCKTMTDFAYRRVSADEKMPGLFVCSKRVPIREIIESILLVVEASTFQEWDGRIEFLPY